MADRIADDFNFIQRKSPPGKMEDCWCYKSGENGITLPCPPLNTAPVVVQALSEAAVGLVDVFYKGTYCYLPVSKAAIKIFKQL